jgi:hypothetical protein
MRLGIASELRAEFTEEINEGVMALGREWGGEVSEVADQAGERACDVLLAIGNVDLFPDLVQRPRTAARVLWLCEGITVSPGRGALVHRHLPTGKLLDTMGRIAPPLWGSATFVRAREGAAMVREPLANLKKVRHGAYAFDRLVGDSVERATALKSELETDGIAVPLGYHAAYAGPLRTGGVRPIDVLFLGFYVGRVGRRQRLVGSITRQLKRQQIDVKVVTGKMFGAPRRRTLEEARLVLDIHRIPGNFNGHRFILATAAGAAVIGEPINDPSPLQPGVHFVECTYGRMADEVASLLSDEPRRLRLVAAAQELLRTEMSLATSLPRVLGPFLQDAPPLQDGIIVS